MEVVHYLQKQLVDSQTAIDRFLHLEDTKVAELTQEDIVTATALPQDHANTGIGGRDATVLAAMHRHDVTELWTHDTGLKRLDDRLDWLTVVDPVIAEDLEPIDIGEETDAVDETERQPYEN
ncbi:hypothetical protein [Halomicrococcus gelatinilyticus]|uniref:hypothetical protein n=1 Tax=Halomicrococcus gelatinilyticus TaxID=1702103 RepID=UPI0038995A5E